MSPTSPISAPIPDTDTLGYDLRSLLVLACNGESESLQAWARAGWLDLRDANGDTVLEVSARLGHERGVETLLAAGADPDQPDEDGWSALHLAARHGPSHTLKTLALASKRIDAPTRGGHTALSLACIRGRIDLVKILLELGGSLDAPAGSDKEPSRVAADLNATEIVELLATVRSVREAEAISRVAHEAAPRKDRVRRSL